MGVLLFGSYTHFICLGQYSNLSIKTVSVVFLGPRYIQIFWVKTIFRFARRQLTSILSFSRLSELYVFPMDNADVVGNANATNNNTNVSLSTPYLTDINHIMNR